MAEYGLPVGPHPDFEIDHLDAARDRRRRRRGESLARAAADRSSRSGTPRRKDRLEWQLRDLICAGQLDVAEAQRMMAEDWVEAYGRFFPLATGAMEPR